MYAEKLLELAGKIKSEDLREEFTDCINKCFDYTNTIAMTAFQIEMSDGDVTKIDFYNGKRNNEHDRLCKALNSLNIMAQEKGMEKIFDFELQEMQKNGRFAGYSQDNHYKTAEMASLLINEINYLGRHTYRTLSEIEKMQTELVEQAQRHSMSKLSYEKMVSQMEKYNETHYGIDKILRENPDKEIVIESIKNGDRIAIVQNDDFSFDVSESYISENTELSDFLNEDGTGEDIPISMLRDYIEENQGFNVISMHELEQEIEQDSFEDFLAEANERAKNEIRTISHTKEKNYER